MGGFHSEPERVGKETWLKAQVSRGLSGRAGGGGTTGFGVWGFFKYTFIYFLFIYFWVCWVFPAARGLLIAVASLVAEHGL